jgi:hypothetical protein
MKKIILLIGLSFFAMGDECVNVMNKGTAALNRGVGQYKSGNFEAAKSSVFESKIFLLQAQLFCPQNMQSILSTSIGMVDKVISDIEEKL